MDNTTTSRKPTGREWETKHWLTLRMPLLASLAARAGGSGIFYIIQLLTLQIESKVTVRNQICKSSMQQPRLRVGSRLTCVVARMLYTRFLNRKNNVVTCSVVDPDPSARSGSRRSDMTHKNRKSGKFYVLKCWMFSFESWNFSCSLDVFMEAQHK